jgi:hypothetical protein
VIVARSLDREVRFHCPDNVTTEALAYVAAAPRMSPPIRDPIDVAVSQVEDGYYDFDRPQVSNPGTAGHMVERAHRILRDVFVEETRTDPVIHGGSLLVDGRRFVVIAGKGTGKTTFLLKCLSSGVPVEADEHVVVRQDHLLARPRTMRIKASSLDLMPELGERILASPAVKDWAGNAIYSFAPRTDAVDWQIAPGRASFLVFLEPNHGGLTSAARLGREEAFERLLKSIYLPPRGRGPALARVHCLAGETKCYKMRIGELSRALWHLKQLARAV